MRYDMKTSLGNCREHYSVAVRGAGSFVAKQSGLFTFENTWDKYAPTTKPVHLSLSLSLPLSLSFSLSLSLPVSSSHSLAHSSLADTQQGLLIVDASL